MNDTKKVVTMLSEEFSELENKIIFDIIRRIKKVGKITSTADYQLNKLRNLGWSTESIEKMLMEYLDLTYNELFRLYDDVEKSGYARDTTLYTVINNNSYKNNKDLMQFINILKEQAKTTINGLSQSVGFLVLINGNYAVLPLVDYVYNCIDNAIISISSGAFSYDEILKKTVKEMTSKGLCIEQAGKIFNVDTFITRAVMSTMSQLQGRIAKMNADILGTDLFEVDWHAGARPDHQSWQGKVYTKKELETICGEGTVTGLKGVNCYHYYQPFLKGSQRQWSDEWLEKQNKLENTPKEFNGRKYTAYEARQKQRQLERLLRKQRQSITALKKGGYDERKLRTVQSRYKTTLGYYKGFTRKMKLTNNINRVYRDGLGRVL